MLKRVMVQALLMICCQGVSFASDGKMIVQLPFPDGMKYECVQNSDDKPTHQYDSTRYDLDFALNEGSIVVAAANGTAWIGSNPGGFGNYVKIDHGNGYFTLYGHLMDGGNIVRDGQTVVAGQPIAFSGNTGNSTGPHLHFGVHTGIGVGKSVKMDVLAREYTSEGQFLKEGLFTTGDVSERDCYCRYNKDDGNAKGHKYESIPLSGLLNQFQYHKLDDGSVLCWQGHDGNFAFCDDGEHHVRYYQSGNSFKSESVTVGYENLGRMCYPSNKKNVNLYAYLTSTGVGGSDATNAASPFRGDANVKEVTGSIQGLDNFQGELVVSPRISTTS